MAQDRQKILNIQSLDPHGQGVAKDEGEVYFIPKTLPGEVVEVKITKSSKGVHFARCLNIITQSSERTQPECPHYIQCQGCHYLHTDYQNELNAKKRSVCHILSKVKSFDKVSKIHASPSRNYYRNRIQLHYDLKRNLIGLKDSKHQILPIPQCRLPEKPIAKKLQQLNESNNWQKLIPLDKPKGHMEIQTDLNGQVQVHLNKNYSFGGFRQVNQKVNEKLQTTIAKTITLLDPSNTVLDLFCGDGNLTNQVTERSKFTGIDSYLHQPPYRRFLQLNLFKQNTPPQTLMSDHFRTVLLDPPRSGFKHLPVWMENLRPGYLIYVSCNPWTLQRDLVNLYQLNPFEIIDVQLFDLFPGTYHIETFVSIKFLNSPFT
jgi:23S rRNA (uracil1939-C5)-methyltransferase